MNSPISARFVTASGPASARNREAPVEGPLALGAICAQSAGKHVGSLRLSLCPDGSICLSELVVTEDSFERCEGMLLAVAIARTWEYGRWQTPIEFFGKYSAFELGFRTGTDGAARLEQSDAGALLERFGTSAG